MRKQLPALQIMHRPGAVLTFQAGHAQLETDTPSPFQQHKHTLEHAMNSSASRSLPVWFFFLHAPQAIALL
jgi:hypothetical protein